jgi:hypothetical protein
MAKSRNKMTLHINAFLDRSTERDLNFQIQHDGISLSEAIRRAIRERAENIRRNNEHQSKRAS